MEIRTSVDDGTRQVEVAISVQHSYENDPRSAVYRAGRAEIETAHGAALEALFTQIEKYHPIEAPRQKDVPRLPCDS